MNNESHLQYRVRVLLRHPKVALSHFTSATGLQPSQSWTSGDRRVSSDGRELPPHHSSVWSYSIVFRGESNFAHSAARVVETMSEAKADIEKLLRTNGEAMLLVELFGCHNIGDVIETATLGRMVELGLALGIEFFPDKSPDATDSVSALR